MTNEPNAVIVVLNSDVEFPFQVTDAIRQLSGVQSVEPYVIDAASHLAEAVSSVCAANVAAQDAYFELGEALEHLHDVIASLDASALSDADRAVLRAITQKASQAR